MNMVVLPFVDLGDRKYPFLLKFHNKKFMKYVVVDRRCNDEDPGTDGCASGSYEVPICCLVVRKGGRLLGAPSMVG